jgi:hypothetical protein
MHRGAFFFGAGHHFAAWRYPDQDASVAATPATLKLTRPAKPHAKYQQPIDHLALANTAQTAIQSIASQQHTST